MPVTISKVTQTPTRKTKNSLKSIPITMDQVFLDEFKIDIREIDLSVGKSKLPIYKSSFARKPKRQTKNTKTQKSYDMKEVSISPTISWSSSLELLDVQISPALVSPSCKDITPLIVDGSIIPSLARSN